MGHATIKGGVKTMIRFFVLATFALVMFSRDAGAQQYNVVCIYNDTKDAPSRKYFEKVNFAVRWCDDEDCSKWKRNSVTLTQRYRSWIRRSACNKGCYFNIRYHVAGDRFQKYRISHIVTSNRKRCNNRNSHYFGMRGDVLELWKGKP